MELNHEHHCTDPSSFPTDKFLQVGTGKGARVLLVGESLAPNGWRNSGRAFYSSTGDLIASGKNLNALLQEFGLTVETCGFTDLIKCYVGDDKRLKLRCGQRCWPIFKRQLESQDFRLIITLGAVTLEVLNRALKTTCPMGQVSTAHIDNKHYLLFPIYHTSRPYLLNDNKTFLSRLRAHSGVQGILKGGGYGGD